MTPFFVPFHMQHKISRQNIYISLKTFIPLNTLLLTKLLTQSYIKNDEKLWQLLLKITICDTKPKVAIFS